MQSSARRRAGSGRGVAGGGACSCTPPPFNFKTSFLVDVIFLYFKKFIIRRLGFLRVLLGADL